MKSFPEAVFSPERDLAPDLCIGCGICRDVCPSGALVMENGKPSFRLSICIGCGHCGVFCPENAFNLQPNAGDSSAASAESFRALLKGRRSTRIFNDKVPSVEDIDNLISVVGLSPTGRNSQGLHVIAYRGRDEVDKLLAPVIRGISILCSTGIPQLIGALTGMGDYVGRIRSGEDMVFRKAPLVLFFFVPRRNLTYRSDGIIAATNVMIHAESMGMAAFWNGVAEKVYPLVASWHLPQTRGMKLTAVLCAGYSDLKRYQEAPRRKYDLSVMD